MKEKLKRVGFWGQWHYQYLKETKPSAICVMRMNGTLLPHLQGADAQVDS